MESLIHGVPKEYLKKNICKYSVGNALIKGTILRIDEVLTNHANYIDTVGTVAGWSRTVRAQANNTIVFIELSDGSTINNLQIVCDKGLPNFDELLKAGVSFSFRATGKFVKSPGKG